MRGGFRGDPSRAVPQLHAPAAETRAEVIPVDSLLDPPNRFSRPDHIVVIIRGPPGAGKTYVSKLLKVDHCRLLHFYKNCSQTVFHK